ncbi:MAG TPA: SDR family NAD(P)-dependent oxidoreductase [Acidimicrobiales bacterium]
MADGPPQGRVAILTGGTGKLGRGICRAFAKQGITPVALDLHPVEADAAALVRQCDVTDPEACRSAVDEVVERYGRIDILVNLAQAYRCDNAIMELTDDDLRVSYESGPIASMRLMQLCYPHMKALGGGNVVNCVSGAGTQGTPRMGAYGSAKEAIRGLTKAAALEWGADNIKVNCFAPFGGDDPNMHPEYVKQVPLQRYGDPEKDIGSAIVYLASPDCYMTGRTLFLDGGIGTLR